MNEWAHRFLLELIELEKWDAAKWMATGFGVPVGKAIPPWLVVVFTHKDPAKEVFAGLRSKVGRDDEEELLRVSIVEGTFHGNPHSYGVSIGPDTKNVLQHFLAEPSEQDSEIFFSLCRVNQMNPDGPSQHLALFKQQFRKVGSYVLMPGIYREKSLIPIGDLGVNKRAIFFRRKEDILAGDLDSTVLLE